MNATFDHVTKLISSLRTPPENDAIYGVITRTDADVQDLAFSIAESGILEPLVVSADGYVLSGNRRLTAAGMAGLTSVPCRVVDVTRGNPDFIKLLVQYNAQRVKNIHQQAAELAVTINPDTAHRELVLSRQQRSEIQSETIDLGAVKNRSAIRGNRPLADAAAKIISDMRDEWPLSDRQIHYLLLNAPPLIHSNKPTRYSNDSEGKCYRTLTNVLTRMRIDGEIPFEAIADATRPVVTWNAFHHAQQYLRKELNRFLTNYWRDLQQSQTNHIELAVEKMTVQGTLERVASEFTIPLTVGRGFASLPPRHEMVQRWKASGKDRLIVIIVSDLDPAGMTIAQSFGRSLRDDFNVPADRLAVVKAALTKEQIDEYNLPPGAPVKTSSSTAKQFIERFGDRVWELEALTPAQLRQIVRDAILEVMDVDALHHEQSRERDEAHQLSGYRSAVLEIFEHGQKLGGVQ